MTDNEKARDLLTMIKVEEPNEFIVNSWWGSFAKDYRKALQMAIKALEQQTCEDCISREDALQALCKAVHKNDNTIPCLNQRVSCLWDKTKVQDYAKEILKLPPVTPKEKTGHWVKTPKAVMGEGYMWYCDKCEHQVYQDSSRDYPSEKYCPNCGARMVESQESEGKEVDL